MKIPTEEGATPLKPDTILIAALQSLLTLRAEFQRDHHDEMVKASAPVTGVRDERRFQSFGALVRLIDEAIKSLQQSVATLAQIQALDHPAPEVVSPPPTESEIIQHVKSERDAARQAVATLSAQLAETMTHPISGA